MGYVRLFRRTRIAPGVRLNLSKSGPSVSFGGRGFHYTVGHHRRRSTVGIPGTGVSYTTYSHRQARGNRRASVAHSQTPGSGAVLAQLWQKPPLAKIGYGLIYTVLIITSPIGVPLLLTGIIQLFLPAWRARALIDRAQHKDGAEAKALLDRASLLHPGSSEVTVAYAQWYFDQQQWDQAVVNYAEYLKVAPDDWIARGHWAQALLNAGHWDEAITALQSMRQAPLDDDARASVGAHLALAFLHKNDAPQGLEIAKAENLRAQHLGPGQLQCLFTRALASYLCGQRAKAIADLDRLYATDPSFGGLAETKAAMQAGTYNL